MMAGPDSNRRGARRYPLDVDARVGDVQARTRDMSSRGLYLVMPRKLEVGSSLDVDLDLPEGAPSGPVHLQLRVRVVRVEELTEGTGVAAEIEVWNVV
jgi:hypothetical protein